MESTDILPAVKEDFSQDTQHKAMARSDKVLLERLPDVFPDSIAEAEDSGLFSQDEPSASSSQGYGGSSNGQESASSTTSQVYSETAYDQNETIGAPYCLLDVEGKECKSLWTEKEELAITKPFDYVAALPGKNFRAQILSALNVWLQVDSESLSAVDRVVAKLHNASLLIDDIQDGSELRRGSPTAHCVFGTAQSINSANYAYFLAQQELLSLRNPAELMQIFVEELLNLHRGQGIEIFWRETLTVPTEQEYLLMISNKTGGLFRLAARLMQAISSTEYDILPLAELVGLIFQIRDDYQNLCCEKMASAKGFCEDLTEGKFSLPVIHSIYSSATTNNEVFNILKLHTKDVNLKSHALWFMRTQTKSLDYTRKRLNHFHECAQGVLGKIEMRNELMEALLGKLRLD